ncbi:cornifelin-like [Symsagittifera roscoffensis]|uniref:cornifelin-like n=1 Tax=Symsagittifera roscoffensis TaxID=84072 RepID=UPI00307B2620
MGRVIPNAGFVNPQYNFPPQSGKGVSGGFKVPPKMFDMPNKWKTGLLGGCCESPSLCLGVYCCPLCCLCKASGDLGESVFVPICVPLPLLSLRLKTRMLFRIKGSLCDDCLLATCCHPCTQLQMQNQLNQMIALE